MAANKVRTDYEELTAIAQVFGQQAETAQQIFGALQDDLNTLQSGDWVGRGAEAFYAEMNSAVLPAVQRVVAAMREAARTTQEIRRIMKQAEDEAAALFRLNGSNGLHSAILDPSQIRTGDNAAPIPAAFAGGPPIPAAGGPGGSTGTASGGVIKSAVRGRDARAEKIQPLLDEAKNLKELYEDTRRVAQDRKATYKEAVRLKKDERVILRLKAEHQAALQAEEFFKEDMNKKYNEAIDLTIKLYKIDVSAVKGNPEYLHGSGLSGSTEWDRTVSIGKDGVSRSPGWLASTIGHEAMHARQMKEGRAYDDEDKQGYAMNDNECFQWELDNAERTGLTEGEIDMIRQSLEDEYLKLDRTNQERVNRRIYVPAKENKE